MEFLIVKRPKGDTSMWIFRDAAGEEIAVSPDWFTSEQECRANIATTKTAMRSARYAKVLVEKD